MIRELYTYTFLIGLMVFAFVAYMVPDRAFTLVGLGSVSAFLFQVGFLLIVTRNEIRAYSDIALFWQTLFYAIVVSLAFMGISYYYDGDTFLFSKGDAKWYYDLSVRYAGGDLWKGIGSIMSWSTYDDWGALIFDTLLMSLWKNKLCLNLVYLLTGCLSVVYLYRLGQHFMERRYAYLAALTYGTSSFFLFFICSFLKESIFTFLVVASIYHLYQVVAGGSRKALVPCALSLFLILFFRPAVAALIVAPTVAYYAYIQKRNAVSLFLYGFALVMVVYSLNDINTIIARNTLGGNLDAVVGVRSREGYSSDVNYAVSFLAAYFGPFPTMYPTNPDSPSHVVFYAGGLIVKLFLLLPFWVGTYYAVRHGKLQMLPLLGFILLEMTATGYVCASLELRKVITHIPFIYIICYYGIAKLEAKEIRLPFPFAISYLVVVAMLILWNVFK